MDREFTLEELDKICRIANHTLSFFREKYLSLFLTNYRDFGRKRISFELAHLLIKNAITKL
jgi:hypothetical protein